MPAVVYKRVTTDRDETHDGPSGLVDARFQFDCWADTTDGAEAVANQLRDALHGWSGTSAGVRIDAIHSAGEMDLDDPETGRERVIADYVIAHAEL